MSSLKNAVAILENETYMAVAEGPTGERQTGPVLVTSAGKRSDNVISRRVEAALDADFANGSMPA